MNITINRMPVVIGGNGGSGTRAVAQILISSGMCLGRDLNKANDNLLFTYLFRHKRLFENRINRFDDRQRRLFDLHEKLLLGGAPTTREELRIVFGMGWRHAFGRYNPVWVSKRWLRMFLSRTVKPISWGWKEPNSMYFLPGLRDKYPGSKFVLVLRNGLDMSFSKNNRQLKYWGKAFGVDPEDFSPLNRFEFWYRSNKQAIELGEELFGEDFLSLHLETLCLNKSECVRELIEFAGFDFNNSPKDILDIPRLPKSYNRYQNHDTRWIDQSVKEKLAELGYEL
ncbi:MAG: sulfotransferase [Thermodesulfobacteriota bacterium]|nr:sulfotransferase [Thermodesulfobacteriota bacterium]